MRQSINHNDIYPLLIHFTANTTSELLQRRIESKLTKQRKGIMYSSAGKGLLLISEDLHMAKVDNS